MALFNTRSEATNHFERSPSLDAMRTLSNPVVLDQMEFFTRQLALLLDDYYVHLPLKRSSLGVDPVQEALLLLDELRFISVESEFYRRVFTIVKRLRDRHTAVRLPSPWREAVAYLPFAIEFFFSETGRHGIISKLMADVDDPFFVEGVQVTHWNGMRIGRCVENLSWDTEGANPFARIAIAMRSLTTRPLGYMKIPDEDWVALTYVAMNGDVRTVVVPWRIYFPAKGSATQAANSTASVGAALSKGLDRSTLLVNNAWYDLYQLGGGAATRGVVVSDTFSDYVSAKVASTPQGEWGYIRIFSFEVADPAAFVRQLEDILSQLPSRGVIIDVRANPGGSIPAGEGLMSLFTPNVPRLQPTSFRNTPATRSLGELPAFASWQSSLDIQLETGEVFSQGFPLTTEIEPPQTRYDGNVVVIVDALSYSTTDFFAAGMQDNGLATIIGIDPVTGAGGANVWSHSVLSSLAASVSGEGLAPMPTNIDIDVAMRRSTRVGPHEGIPVEGLGVFAERTYFPTREDVLDGNDGLINFAAEVLASMQ